jgi:hypothetical protein
MCELSTQLENSRTGPIRHFSHPDFYWFEPVLYIHPVSKFPKTTERPGYFVGFDDNVEDSLTFKVMKNDLSAVLHRNVVRSAADANHLNKRVTSKPDVQERLDELDNESRIIRKNWHPKSKSKMQVTWNLIAQGILFSPHDVVPLINSNIYTRDRSKLGTNESKKNSELPKVIKNAIFLDKKNRKSLWQDTIWTKLRQPTDCQTFKVLDWGEDIPKGYQEIPFPIVFDVKYGLQHKAWLVAGGYWTVYDKEEGKNWILLRRAEGDFMIYLWHWKFLFVWED